MKERFPSSPPQPRSQAPLPVGEDPGNLVASPVTFPLPPLVFCLLLLLLLLLFFSASSFRAITRAVTVATRAHLELESFVTG